MDDLSEEDKNLSCSDTNNKEACTFNLKNLYENLAYPKITFNNYKIHTTFQGVSEETVTVKETVPNIAKKTFCCNQCNRKFKVEKYLKMHMKLHNCSYLQCGKCNKAYFDENMLWAHFNSKHVNKNDLFSCNDCGKCFTLKRNLRQHAKTHKNKKDYCCQECNREFCHASSLKRHKAIHNGSETCKICFINFKCKITLTKHIKESHPIAWKKSLVS